MQYSPPLRHGWHAIGATLLFTLSLSACDAGNTPTPRTSAPSPATNPGVAPTPTPSAGGSAPVHAPPGPPPNPPDRATGSTSVTPLANDTGAAQPRAPAGTGSSSGGAGTSGMAGSGAAAGSGGSTDERR